MRFLISAAVVATQRRLQQKLQNAVDNSEG